MSLRQIISVSSGHAASDGAGVRLTRVFGGTALERFDPFLMLDEFGSNDPDDYIAGFPAHPHRGFETITYMLEGRMRHEDHLGNVGLLESGGVQWMTAARGIIHSEMPEQQQGTMRGFQLWLNLPASAKLGEPGYRDFAPTEIPQLTLPNGVVARVIAGRLQVGDSVQAGMVQRPVTEPQLFDLQLPTGAELAPAIPDGHRLLLYVFEGELQLGETTVGKGQLVRLGEHGALQLHSGPGARLLLLAGRPLNEPIVNTARS